MTHRTFKSSVRQTGVGSAGHDQIDRVDKATIELGAAALAVDGHSNRLLVLTAMATSALSAMAAELQDPSPPPVPGEPDRSDTLDHLADVLGGAVVLVKGEPHGLTVVSGGYRYLFALDAVIPEP